MLPFSPPRALRAPRNPCLLRAKTAAVAGYKCKPTARTPVGICAGGEAASRLRTPALRASWMMYLFVMGRDAFSTQAPSPYSPPRYFPSRLTQCQYQPQASRLREPLCHSAATDRPQQPPFPMICQGLRPQDAPYLLMLNSGSRPFRGYSFRLSHSSDASSPGTSCCASYLHLPSDIRPFLSVALHSSSVVYVQRIPENSQQIS